MANNESIHKIKSEHFYESHILFHKVKGAQFGMEVDSIADAFLSVANEVSDSMSEEIFRDIVTRQINPLFLLYGLAHSQITLELNEMTSSWISDYMKK